MRLFIAIQFSPEILDALVGVQSEMKSFDARGRYSPPENLHLTLAFIGEYGNPDAVIDVLNSVPFEPFPLRLDRLGNFGDLYWAGIADSPQLATFVKRLRRALADRNIPFDRKRFSPHITLVRKAEYYGETPLPPVHAPEGEMEVSGVVLMRSDRGKHGMIYTEVGRIGE
ncbi:MAG: RNA 2',3'-cyclic phosphodiesterase [Schwartzia sp.]|nr:RNA 2',3'-cyclic phosphodiesterase [Schwartzia sp. (in: firmicutes)]